MGNLITNEQLLVEKAKTGDRNAFNELVLIHAAGVQNVVYRMCGNLNTAKDAAQEAFIQAWIKLPSFRSNSSFKNWLYKIAINTAVDMLRKEKRIIGNPIEEIKSFDSNPGPENMYAIKERSEFVQQAILSLPEGSKSVLILREYEGLSYRQIAKILNIPKGTVMSRLNYARKVLRGKLEATAFQKEGV